MKVNRLRIFFITFPFFIGTAILFSGLTGKWGLINRLGDVGVYTKEAISSSVMLYVLTVILLSVFYRKWYVYVTTVILSTGLVIFLFLYHLSRPGFYMRKCWEGAVENSSICLYQKVESSRIKSHILAYESMDNPPSVFYESQFYIPETVTIISSDSIRLVEEKPYDKNITTLDVHKYYNRDKY